MHGDIWDEDYPPVISGHIHNEQRIGKNVFYPGASIQHSFDETPDKYIWLVTFADEVPEDEYFLVEKISLGLRQKRVISVTVEEAEEFDLEILDKSQVKLDVHGSPSEIEAFKTSRTRQQLAKRGVLFKWPLSVATSEAMKMFNTFSPSKTQSKMSYVDVFSKIVDLRGDENVRSAYMDIFGNDSLMPTLGDVNEDTEGTPVEFDDVNEDDFDEELVFEE